MENGKGAALAAPFFTSYNQVKYLPFGISCDTLTLLTEFLSVNNKNSFDSAQSSDSEDDQHQSGRTS